MNTRELAVTIIFAAVTVALNPVFTKIAIPAPYAPFLFYQIWEIPIVTAFVLIGRKSAFAIAGLNSIVLLALFPGLLALGPFYNLAAILAMLSGVIIAEKLVSLRTKSQNPQADSTLLKGTQTTLSTVLGIVLRVAIMTVVNYAVLRFAPPVGYNLSEIAIIGMLPLIGIFNATLALYTIPSGYLLATVIKRNLKLSNKIA